MRKGENPLAVLTFEQFKAHAGKAILSFPEKYLTILYRRGILGLTLKECGVGMKKDGQDLSESRVRRMLVRIERIAYEPDILPF